MKKKLMIVLFAISAMFVCMGADCFFTGLGGDGGLFVAGG